MRGARIVRYDLECEHGPVGECYASKRNCVQCRKDYSQRPEAKERQREYMRSARRREYERSPERLAQRRVRRGKHKDRERERGRAYRMGMTPAERQANRENLKAWYAANRARLALERKETLRDPYNFTRFCLGVVRNRNKKLGVCAPDFDHEWLQAQIEEALARGEVSLNAGSPDLASVDQRIAGLGYHRANIQVVPLWYNFAKAQWTDAEVADAITKWVCARALGE